MISLPSISLPALPKFGSSEGFSRVMKLAVPVGSLAVSAIVLIFVVWPTIGRVINLNISNKQFLERAASLETKAQTLNSLDKNVLDRQLSAGEQLLPSDKGVFSMVQQIEKEASATGVVLEKIDVAPGSLGDTLSSGQSQSSAANQQQPAGSSQSSADLGSLTVNTPKVQLKVSISSDYQGLLRFLDGLDSLPRVLSVHDLTIAASGGGSSSGAIKSQMAIDAFWEPLPHELPPVESPITPLTDAEAKVLENIKFSEVANVPASSGTVSVPTGKSDIFAPF